MRLIFLILKTCQNNSFVKYVVHVLQMAFRVQKVFGAFEKRAPGLQALEVVINPLIRRSLYKGA